jgi:hypothetical protein
MTAIVPFPLAGRTAFVERHATKMACLPRPAAERYLNRQLEIQREALSRKGIKRADIDAELKSLERALRLGACRRSDALKRSKGFT